MEYFINFYIVFLIIVFFFFMVLVHIMTYKVFDGDIFTSGGNNEIFSIIFLFSIFKMFRSKDITQDEIQEKLWKFERKLAKDHL
jgi:uncharacterized protein YhhL (DUF1145 family)